MKNGNEFYYAAYNKAQEFIAKTDYEWSQNPPENNTLSQMDFNLSENMVLRAVVEYDNGKTNVISLKTITIDDDMNFDSLPPTAEGEHE